MANHGDMLSTCSCHLGGFFGGLGRLLRRMFRIATARRPTPMAILTASAPMDGAVFGLGGLLPVVKRHRLPSRLADLFELTCPLRRPIPLGREGVRSGSVLRWSGQIPGDVSDLWPHRCEWA